MKIKWGSIVTDGRNKLGGQVYSKNSSGAYVRNKVTPVNPKTASQVTVRSRLSGISAGWRGLSDNDRKAWNASVADYKKTDIFGDIQNPSGFNLYQKLNNNLANIGGTALTVPPVPQSVSVFATASVVVNGVTPTITATVTPATLPAAEKLIVRATIGQSAGKTFIKSEFRQIAVISTITGGTINLLTAYEAKFGVPVSDMKYFFEFIHVNTNTGQASLAQQVSAVAS